MENKNYIHITDEYYFTADKNNYILIEHSATEKLEFGTKKPTGDTIEKYTEIGYYSALDTLIKSLVIIINRQSILTGEIKTLNECVAKIESVYSDISKAINKSI